MGTRKWGEGIIGALGLGGIGGYFGNFFLTTLAIQPPFFFSSKEKKKLFPASQPAGSGPLLAPVRFPGSERKRGAAELWVGFKVGGRGRKDGGWRTLCHTTCQGEWWG